MDRKWLTESKKGSKQQGGHWFCGIAPRSWRETSTVWENVSKNLCYAITHFLTSKWISTEGCSWLRSLNCTEWNKVVLIKNEKFCPNKGFSAYLFGLLNCTFMHLQQKLITSFWFAIIDIINKEKLQGEQNNCLRVLRHFLESNCRVFRDSFENIAKTSLMP